MVEDYRSTGVDPAWTLLTFDSLRALRQEPSAVQTASRRDRRVGGGAKQFILLRQATKRGGLQVTATGNPSCAVVAEMCLLLRAATTGRWL
jgi:hypothetical protein